MIREYKGYFLFYFEVIKNLYANLKFSILPPSISSTSFPLGRFDQSTKEGRRQK
jgi:hypothetical protein